MDLEAVPLALALEGRRLQFGAFTLAGEGLKPVIVGDAQRADGGQACVKPLNLSWAAKACEAASPVRAWPSNKIGCGRTPPPHEVRH